MEIPSAYGPLMCQLIEHVSLPGQSRAALVLSHAAYPLETRASR